MTRFRRFLGALGLGTLFVVPITVIATLVITAHDSAVCFEAFEVSRAFELCTEADADAFCVVHPDSIYAYRKAIYVLREDRCTRRGYEESE